MKKKIWKRKHVITAAALAWSFEGFIHVLYNIYVYVCANAHIYVFSRFSKVFRGSSRFVKNESPAGYIHNNIQYRKRRRRRWRWWHLVGARLNVFCLSVFRDFHRPHIYTYTVYRIIHWKTEGVFLYAGLCRWGRLEI